MHIINFEPKDHSTIKGFFDLQLESSGMIIKGFKLMRTQNEHIWISPPSSKFKTDEGKDAWYPYVKFIDRDSSDKFQKHFLEKLKEKTNQDKKENRDQDQLLPF